MDETSEEYYARLESGGHLLTNELVNACFPDGPIPEADDHRLWIDEIVSTRLQNVICNYFLPTPSREITVRQVREIDDEPELLREPNCGRKTLREFNAWKSGLPLGEFEGRKIDAAIERLEEQVRRLKARRKKIT